MARTVTARRLLAGAGLSVLVGLGLYWFFGARPSHALVPAEVIPADPESPALAPEAVAASLAFSDLTVVRQVARSFDASHRVGLVRFASDWVKRPSVTPAGEAVPGVSLTNALVDVNGKPCLMVSGTFSLVEEFHSPPVPLGEVKRGIPMGAIKEQIPTPGGYGDPALRRLGSLLKAQEQDQPLTLLAVWPKDARKVLDATFTGPLSPADVAQLTDLAAVLRKEAYDDLRLERAEQLLESKGPQRVWLALARLQDLRKVTPAHFRQALAALPVGHVSQAVRAMFDVAIFNDSFRGSLSDQLLSLTDSVPKQLQLVETVVEALKSNRFGARELLDLKKLQERAREIRKKHHGDAECKEVVRQIDLLLEL